MTPRIPSSPTTRLSDDGGSALIVVLLATMLLTSLGIGLVMLSNTEATIAANFRSGNETLYAADAALERVVQDLLMAPRWNDVLAGTLQSAFVDGSLTPTTPYGERLDLNVITARLQTESDAGDPWGPNNPEWRLFAYGPLSEMLSASIQSLTYVAVWVADDPSETDDDPAADGNGVVTVRAEAWGPHGTHRTIEVTLARTDSQDVARDQIEQEALNQRASSAAVQMPGKSLSAADLNVSTGGMVAR